MGDRPEGMNDEEIRADIQQTREELSETIDAIQERLRPRHLVAQVGESVRDATIGQVKEMATNAGDMASGVMSQTRDAAETVIERVRANPIVDRIREHPVPALLAGIGLAWLAMADAGPAARRGFRRGYYGDTGTVGTSGRTGDVSGREASYGSTYETHESTGGFRRAAEGVRRTSRQAGNQMQQAMQSNPLAMGAIALGVGAAIGFALPETERENEWMGESRDAMVDRAQDMARDAAERVKNAAESVKGAADQAIDTIARGE